MDNQNFVSMIVAGLFVAVLVITVISLFHSSFDEIYSPINPNASVSLQDFSNITSEAVDISSNMENSTNAEWGVSTYKNIGFGVLRTLGNMPRVYNALFNSIARDSEGYIDSRVITQLYFVMLVLFVLAIVFIVFGVFL